MLRSTVILWLEAHLGVSLQPNIEMLKKLLWNTGKVRGDCSKDIAFIDLWRYGCCGIFNEHIISASSFVLYAA